jgi:hypothetical protein
MKEALAVAHSQGKEALRAFFLAHLERKYGPEK